MFVFEDTFLVQNNFQQVFTFKFNENKFFVKYETYRFCLDSIKYITFVNS